MPSDGDSQGHQSVDNEHGWNASVHNAPRASAARLSADIQPRHTPQTGSVNARVRLSPLCNAAIACSNDPNSRQKCIARSSRIWTRAYTSTTRGSSRTISTRAPYTAHAFHLTTRTFNQTLQHLQQVPRVLKTRVFKRVLSSLESRTLRSAAAWSWLRTRPARERTCRRSSATVTAGQVG